MNRLDNFYIQNLPNQKIQKISNKDNNKCLKQINKKTHILTNKIIKTDYSLSESCEAITSGNYNKRAVDTQLNTLQEFITKSTKDLDLLESNLASAGGSIAASQLQREIARDREILDQIKQRQELLLQITDPDVVKAFVARKDANEILNRAGNKKLDGINAINKAIIICQKVIADPNKPPLVKAQIEQVRAFLEKKISVIADKSLALTDNENALKIQISNGNIDKKVKAEQVAKLIFKLILTDLYFTQPSEFAGKKQELDNLLNNLKGHKILWEEIKQKPHLKEIIAIYNSSDTASPLVTRVHSHDHPRVVDPQVLQELQKTKLNNSEAALASIKMNSFSRFCNWIFNRKTMKVAAEVEGVAYNALKMTKYLENSVNGLKAGTSQAAKFQGQLAGIDAFIANHEMLLKQCELKAAAMGTSGVGKKLQVLIDAQKQALDNLKRKKALLAKLSKDIYSQAAASQKAVEEALSKVVTEPSSAGGHLYKALEQHKQLRQLAQQHGNDPEIGESIKNICSITHDKIMGQVIQGKLRLPKDLLVLKAQLLNASSQDKALKIANASQNDKQIAAILAYEITEALYFTSTEELHNKIHSIERLLQLVRQNDPLWAKIQAVAGLPIKEILADYQQNLFQQELADVASLINAIRFDLAQAAADSPDAAFRLFKAKQGLENINIVKTRAAEASLKTSIEQIYIQEQNSINRAVASFRLTKSERKLQAQIIQRHVPTDKKALARVKPLLQKQIVLALESKDPAEINRLLAVIANLCHSHDNKDIWAGLKNDHDTRIMLDALLKHMVEDVRTQSASITEQSASKLKALIKNTFTLIHSMDVKVARDVSDLLCRANMLSNNPLSEQQALDAQLITRILGEIETTGVDYTTGLDRNLLFLENPSFLSLFKGKNRRLMDEFAAKFKAHRVYAKQLSDAVRAIDKNNSANAITQLTQLFSGDSDLFKEYYKTTLELSKIAEGVTRIAEEKFRKGEFQQWFDKLENANVKAQALQDFKVPSIRDDSYLNFTLIATQRYLRLPLLINDLAKNYGKTNQAAQFGSLYESLQWLGFTVDSLNGGRA